jgi:hypothetical protein
MKKIFINSIFLNFFQTGEASHTGHKRQVEVYIVLVSEQLLPCSLLSHICGRARLPPMTARSGLDMLLSCDTFSADDRSCLSEIRGTDRSTLPSQCLYRRRS